MNSFSSRIALIGVGAVLFAAGVAGCGGSSDDDSGDALSKDDYIAQANEICSSLTAELDSLESDFTTAFQSGDTEGAADVMSEGNEKVSSTLDELEALVPPEEDQATLDEYFDLQDEQRDLSDQVIDAVRDGDQQTMNDIGDQIDASQTKSDTIADDYGMTECGSASNE